LPEQSTATPEVIHTPENIKESLSISAETSA